MSRSILIWVVLIAVFLPMTAAPQERQFWDFPDPVDIAEGGRFPRLVALESQMALIWQEFQGEPGRLDATITLKVGYSEDGESWGGQPITIVENIPYLWLEEVPLYSVAVGSDGHLMVAVSIALEGVAVYRQLAPRPESGFQRVALLPSEVDVANVAVAPQLVALDGGYRLFLTRRSNTPGASRATMLTLFLSESVNGRNWTVPELFVDPAIDQSPTGGVLEHNFLPSHLSIGSTEYVVFQSLRQASSAQVYQLYLKYRSSGGDWSPAQALTENLPPMELGDIPLNWDNQRAYIGLTAENEILVTWERRKGGQPPGIAAAVLDSSGALVSPVVEEVVRDPYTSAFPQVVHIKGQTWILWFDNTGIRVAQRKEAYDYKVQASSLDAKTPGAERGSAAFPRLTQYQGESYILWQDRTVGLTRAIILRPDLSVDTPELVRANFLGGRRSNLTTLIVDWRAARDSSGILSHSWRWSQNPDDRPSRREADQVFGTSRAIYEFTDPDEEEGDWYFSLISQDQAGNWSEPLRLSYSLDVTPPPPPTVNVPDTGAYGYLSSNTFTIEWRDNPDDPAAYYRWRMDYLGQSSEELDIEDVEAISLANGESTETSRRRVSWSNIDDGIWSFTVAAVDLAGNQGLSHSSILLTNNYIPVTFITSVSLQKDEFDRLTLDIIGRGFSVGGLLTLGIIDRDGQEPWDYEFTRGENRLEILSDRRARIIEIDDIEAGEYRIGVVHPRRGTVLWNRTMRLDATGNVKFGPFDLYTYESLWRPAALSLRLSGNQLLLVILVLLCLVAMIIAVSRLYSITRETRIYQTNARAILTRMPMNLAMREEAAMILRRKGMGLRNKFALALSLLVIFTVLMIGFVLGFVWVRMERATLAEGLENESRLLVETLAFSAATGIQSAERGDLLFLPDRINALKDAQWTTVTGPRSEVVNGILRATSEGEEYVWASNDPDVLDKLALPASLDSDSRRLALEVANEEEQAALDLFYPPSDTGSANLVRGIYGPDRGTMAGLLRKINLMPASIGLGSYLIDDKLSADIEQMRQEAEQAAQDADISRMINELTVLEQQLAELAQEVVLTLDFDNPAFLEAEAAVAAQKKEIDTLLLEIANARFDSYPEFSAEALRPGGQNTFVFYKPLLYRIGSQDASFFRGTVRLAVSVDDIRQSLDRIQRRIIIITAAASAASLAVGILVAMFIASLIVRPITSLARGVSIIRDQPDMLQHEEFDVSLSTGDELATLADTINGMVRGLVQAAVEQKELVAGQEIQKTFLPLAMDEETNKKLSTGGDGNAFFRLFGYYEGADAVSGDYFDFRKLDEDHYVMIKLDIAGHGVTASLIMVQIAALYVDYFRKVRDKAQETGKLKYNLREFTFGINDLINEVGFKGRFAAFNLSVINVRTAEYEMIHAGDNLVHIFDGETRKMTLLELPESPACGQIDSMLIEMNPTMYKSVRGSLKRGDMLFLYTDGIEEAHHIIRNENFEVVPYKDLPHSAIAADLDFIEPRFEYLLPRERAGEVYEPENAEKLIEAALDDQNFGMPLGGAKYKPISPTQDNEEFDSRRIDDVIEAALNKGRYILERRCDLTIGKPLHFDFTTLEGTGQDAVMALASVEKVFRIIPDSTKGTTTRVRVDKKIVEFLKAHFKEYQEFYGHPIDEDAGYVYFSHLREDPQDDDLTIWVYQRL